MKLYRPQLMASVKRMAAREARASGVLALAEAQGISEGEALALWLAIHHRAVKNRAAKRMARRMRQHSTGGTRHMEKQAFASSLAGMISRIGAKKSPRVRALTMKARRSYSGLPKAQKNHIKKIVSAIDGAATGLAVDKINNFMKSATVGMAITPLERGAYINRGVASSVLAQRKIKPDPVVKVKMIPAPKEKSITVVGHRKESALRLERRGSQSFIISDKRLNEQSKPMTKAAFLANLARAGVKMLRKPKIPKAVKSVGAAAGLGAVGELAGQMVRPKDPLAA
ncbi:hypothetical protein FM038_019925 [Shewanella eurypsychrophilus]|uniref:Uncharacterized protein n=1 Tax=Shewanella eurypsychrophilus TaxID=2593656 RepID=A0ABX6V9Q5_9GAMM|nr:MULTISPECIES: hypothetical protein [Shewanella]QFU24193.1 hypothetical protein FS418_21650 [Shewanella sp. YLB-09]QPG59398.1 hypothetical protein FM038_019925 [Shewanella eurypsychrophilus]